MKSKFYLIVLFFTIIIFNSKLISQEYQNWKWLHEKPQGNTLRWVKMWDTNTWYALGLEGTFMKTTNAGATWFFHHRAGSSGSIGGSSVIYDAHFFNKDTGIAVGVGTIRRTTDGGMTFNNVTTPTGTWYQVYFLNDSVGFAAGTLTRRLVKTTDRGLTWTQNTNIPSANYYDVYAPNENVILVASANGNIQYSSDGGSNFTSISVNYNTIVNKLTFKDPNNGWAVGVGGNASYTVDGGLTWIPANSGLPSTSSFNDVDYRMIGSTEQVVLTGDPYNLYATTNNGVTWTTIDFLAPTIQQPFTSSYFSTDFIGNDFVTVGSFGLINSKLSNVNKIYSYVRKTGTIYDIWTNNSGRIITIGAPSANGVNDQIFISVDNGANWTAANLGYTSLISNAATFIESEDDKLENENSSQHLELLTPNSTAIFRSLDMLSDNLGYAVGTNSAVYRTINGGLTWDSLVTNIPAGQDLFKVNFVNANVGWIFSNTANDTGTIWKTTNAGANWTKQSLTGQTGDNTRIYGAHMINDTLGWAINFKPRPYKTTNGGTTWVEQPLSDNYNGKLNKIQMISQNLGYIVGNAGRFYRTTNAGVNWDYDTIPNIPFGLVVNLYSMNFANENFGLIGGSGVAFLTTDGGQTWENVHTGAATATGTLNSLFISSGSFPTAYVAGALGVIMKYSNLEIPVELLSFIGSINKNQVNLEWTTSTEKNNLGFEIERKTLSSELIGSGTDYTKIGFVEGFGTSTKHHSYSFYDKSLSTGKYLYRLKQIDYDGTYSYSNVLEMEIKSPEEYSLTQNYPNPFNPTTRIDYQLPYDSKVTLELYGITGERAATLINSVQSAGYYIADVNAVELNLASGIYIYRMTAQSATGKNFVQVKKLMLTK